MNHAPNPELRCTFEDAEHNNLIDGVRMSTRAKVELFEEMLDFAWRTGSIKTGRATDVTANWELRDRENISKESKQNR